MNVQHSAIPGTSLELAESHPLLKSLFARSVGKVPPSNLNETRRKRGMDEYILQYCASGKAWAEDGPNRWNLDSGNCLIIPPNTPHAYGSNAAEPWLNYWIHFKGTQAKAFFELLGLSRRKWFLHLPPDPECASCIEGILKQYQGEIYFENLLQASSFLRQLLQRLFLLLQGQGSHKRTKGIQAAVQFMEETPSESIDSAKLAKIAGLSRARFHELFRIQIGDTPNKYLTRIRIRASCDLLLTTPKSLEEIALQIGFSNAFYFSRVFRQVMGMPPSAYRKMLR